MSLLSRIIGRFRVKTVIKPIIVVKENENLLEGKTALITGGSSGIGAAIAEKMVKAGAKVFVTGRNEGKLNSLASRIGCQYIVMDVTDIKSTEQALNALFQKEKIDILVNSAGVHGNDPFGKVTEQCFDDVMATNVKALYFMSQMVSNQMIEKHISGHILNVSSASSIKPSWTPYEVSKRAVNGITQGFAHKLIPYGIVVNGIAPGPTATPMMGRSEDISWEGNPSGRMSTVEEIASLALFMVSGQGDGIVGDTFFITGGSGTICIDK